MVSDSEVSSLESRKVQEIFLCFQSAHTNSGDNPASYRMGTSIYLPQEGEGALPKTETNLHQLPT